MRIKTALIVEAAAEGTLSEQVTLTLTLTARRWLLTPFSSESTEYYVSQIHQHNRTMSVPSFF